MRFESELATAFKSCNTFHTFEKYAELLSPELIQQGFEQAGVATLRKRRLPLETVLWSIIGMALLVRGLFYPSEISDRSYQPKSWLRGFPPHLNRNRTCGYTCSPLRYVHC